MAKTDWCGHKKDNKDYLHANESNQSHQSRKDTSRRKLNTSSNILNFHVINTDEYFNYRKMVHRFGVF